MKVTFNSWHSSDAEVSAIKRCGYEDKQSYEIYDVFLVISNLFMCGVNVMIAHRNDNSIMIGVADDMFKCR